MAVREKTTKVPQAFKEILSEYFRLVRQPVLSEEDLDRVSEIWEEAGEDKNLSYYLEQIDFILNNYEDSRHYCQNEQEKDTTERDEELQYFLSEHIEVLTNQKIKERASKDDICDSQNDIDSTCEDHQTKEKREEKYIILCPDGTGYKMLSLNDGCNGETIDQWSQHICVQCGHPYSEHIKFAYRAEAVDE